ncbi:hypothetical protein ABE10_02645 [Bacillus toyonensis]|nr:hypothetical protein [Bacillus toyonensis]
MSDVAQTTALQERADLRVVSAEVAVGVAGVLRAAYSQQAFTEAVAVRASEPAVLPEPLDRVGVEHLAPDVGVVACAVAAREDVGEGGCGVSGRHRGIVQSDVRERCGLESLHVIDLASRCDGVQGLVEPCRREILAREETLVERLGLPQPIDDVGGQGNVRLVVSCVGGQDLWPEEPHLVHLAGELHEVPEHPRAGEVRIGHGGEQSVQGVTELVEEGGDLVEREERRFALAGPGDIEVVDDDR